MGVTEGARKFVLLGHAATGKTTLLQAAVQLAGARGINCLVCYEDRGQRFETHEGTPVRVELRCSRDAASCRPDEVVVVCAKTPEDAAALWRGNFACFDRVCWVNNGSIDAWRAKADKLVPFSPAFAESIHAAEEEV